MKDAEAARKIVLDALAGREWYAVADQPDWKERVAGIVGPAISAHVRAAVAEAVSRYPLCEGDYDEMRRRVARAEEDVAKGRQSMSDLRRKYCDDLAERTAERDEWKVLAKERKP